MDRELVLVFLALVIAGPAVLACGWWPRRAAHAESARRSEHAAWNRIWTPLVPAGLAVGALLGWAIVEPADAELITLPYALAAMPFAALFARVVVRAIRALHPVDRDLPAATVGLFSPRVLISSQFAAAVDPRALEAAREHENAHARHRDPLRLWLAQIATDLQWPWPPARARFEAWTEALEFARDEEARTRNIEGADLAAAVLVAVRMYPGSARSLAASMTGDARALKERIARLMAPPMSDIRPNRERATIAILVGGLFCVVVLGATFGEPVVSTMTASRRSAHAGAGGTDQQRR